MPKNLQLYNNFQADVWYHFGGVEFENGRATYLCVLLVFLMRASWFAAAPAFSWRQVLFFVDFVLANTMVIWVAFPFTNP